jgi:predicted secreted protein
MRALISKVVTGTMIAGAALMISACTKTETTSTNVVDLNATEGMDTTTDNMTATDGAMGNDTGVVANDTTMTTTNTTTTTTNAM